MAAEVFAALCAVPTPPVESAQAGSWTTGSDTGSDPDD